MTTVAYLLLLERCLFFLQLGSQHRWFLFFFTGLFCATFYHFFVHDSSGPVGNFLRQTIPAGQLFGLKDIEFASCVVTYFMQIVGILQLPSLLGPNWSPFNILLVISSPIGGSKNGSEYTKQLVQEEDEASATNNGKYTKSKKKKKSNNKLKKT